MIFPIKHCDFTRGYLVISHVPNVLCGSARWQQPWPPFVVTRPFCSEPQEGWEFTAEIVFFFVGHLIAFTIIDTYIWDHYDIINVICLVVWHRIFIFPYIGNTNPNWLIFFSEGLKPPTSYVYVNDIYYIFKYIQIYSNIIHIYIYIHMLCW